MSNRAGWRTRTISLTVEAMAGSHLTDIGEDMLELSKHLNVGVRCKINGIELYAWPHFTVDDLKRIYEAGRRLADNSITS